MKVLITGATGYIGTLLLQYLMEKGGYEITACDIRPSAIPLDQKVRFLLKDFMELSREELGGQDAVIHLAAISSHADANADWKRAVRTNVWGTLRLAKTAKEAGVKKIIFASSSSVYQVPLGQEVRAREADEVQPLDVYSFTKLEAEGKILPLSSKSFEVVVPRFGTVYGYSPRMRWDILVNIFTYHALKKGVITINDGGEAWRPGTFIADVVRFYEWALNNQIRGIFNVAEGDYTVKQVADIFLKNLTGKKVALDIKPLEKPKEVMSYKMDTSKAEAHGFKCQYKLDEVLAEELRKFSEMDEFK